MTSCFPSSQGTENFVSNAYSDSSVLRHVDLLMEESDEQGTTIVWNNEPVAAMPRENTQEASLFREDYFDSVSSCLYDAPGELSWSKKQDKWHLDVFWSSGHGNDDSGATTPTLSSSIAEALPGDMNDATKGEIKTALQLFKLSGSHTALVQFWAPVFVGNQILLSTSHLHFGLVYYHPGARRKCLDYRKFCMQHKYCVADGDDKNEHHFGPPGRVYCSGLPEFNQHVGDYSIQEYPLLDVAPQFRANTYLGLPVFESLGQRCVGVL